MSSTSTDSHTLRMALQINPELGSHPVVQNHQSALAGERLHLAVMTGPYLDRIVDGSKTVESRFHRIRNAPLDTVSSGDLVAFKRSGHPVSHIAGVRDANFIDMTATPLESVRYDWQERIGDTTDEFWRARANARWASLIEIDWIRLVSPIELLKRDRRGWVTYGPCCPVDALF